MKSFTIAFITGRQEPHWDWLRDSLGRELDRCCLDEPPMLAIDSLHLISTDDSPRFRGAAHVFPKPTIWQGPHRVTKEDWWAMSNARNTAVCCCETEWICFFDDRCVLLPGYMGALASAMDGNYILVGAYEKRERMTVQDGLIVKGAKKDFVIGSDCRFDYVTENRLPMPFHCPGNWLFGAIWAAPIEWLLQVNGMPEICDGQGFEDVQTGLILQHNGFPIQYDARAKIIEDRTEGQIGPLYRREDKGKSPNDKSHALLAIFRETTVKRAIHTPGWDIDLRRIRADKLAGKPWPVPPQGVEWKDWYDGELIKDFK